MKVMEEREKVMKKDKKRGNSYYFGVVKMCKWWLKKFSNGVVKRDLLKTRMGNKSCIINYNKEILVKLKVLEEKTLFSSKKTIDKNLVKFISHNKLYNGRKET